MTMTDSPATNGSAPLAPPTPEEQAVADFDALLDEARADLPPAIQFRLGGEVFTVPSPLDWSDELLDKQTAAAANPDAADIVGLAKEFLGDDQYARFCAAGGSAMKFQLVMPKLMRGATMGESAAS